ncbi:stalk domain-containing protein [Lutispora thermophila]|uniref:Kelch motif-containing protein n=1 Tax=Lutispora thermophila DSM 19022 TaxID=1122184 RepID=A0A1M6DSJ5_9FIRM|nr:stalk domain-containing protein [Lutispora thermophila]SHI76143.1 Kelch motif-containing protein [Lutispora thermophila DSM 19022]
MEYGQAAITLSDGRVLIVGGEKRTPMEDADYKREYIKTEIYNPQNDSFMAVAEMPEGLSGVTAVLLKDNTVLVLGKAYNNKNMAYVYDVNKNIWIKKAKVGYAGTKTLVNSQGNVFSFSPSVLENSLTPGEYYNSIKDEFSTSWVMPNPRTSGACTVMADGKFMIIGGSNGGYSQNANWDADIFDPEKNIWRTTSFMNSGRDNARAFTLPDGRVIVVAGISGKEYFRTTEIYNPISDVWTKGPSLKYTYSPPAALQLKNGNILIMGGYDGKSSNRCEMLVLSPSIKEKSNNSYDSIDNAVLTTLGIPYIKVKGERVILDESNSKLVPVYKDGQTLVPLNFFKSGFGAEVSENTADGTIYIRHEGKTLSLKIGSKELISNGKKSAISASAEKINGTVYVPLRPITEALGKKITWLKGLIAIAGKTVYLDVVSAFDELTQLNSSYLMGITENAKLVKEKPAFSQDGWDYKWYYIKHENASTYFTERDSGEDYTHLYLIRENKKEGRLEQVYEGTTGEILKLEGNQVYIYDNGYLCKIRLGDKYKEYVKSSDNLADSENISLNCTSIYWEDDDFISLDNGMVDGEWIYFTWDPYDYINTLRTDPLGYPMRVKYDGSGLQILSGYRMSPNWRGIYGFEKSGDYLYYLTNRKVIEGSEEQFTLHRVKVDGSDEKHIAEVMYFDIYKDKIYYRQLGESGEYDTVKFYSINLDGTDNKLLSDKGAWEVIYFGDNLYYRIYNDRDGVYTMKTDGSNVRKIGDAQGDLLYADDKYVYYDYNYFDFDNGGFKNMGKYKINIMTGKKEKAE